MENLILKPATILDIASLQKIGRQTFEETFSSANSVENIQNYLNEHFSLDKITQEISDVNSLFYLAMLDNELIGYLKLNLGSSQTEILDDYGIELERIYVLQYYHGKNVGVKLLQKAIEIANNHRALYLWLGVWEHNPRAINFYEKHGFKAFDKHIFKLGEDEQTDVMMKLEIGN